jgi:hypothetical protein
MISVKEKAGQQVTPGTHLAVCYRVVDLGTQPDSGFGQKEKIVIFWELPHERMVFDGVEKPMGISKFYTKSLSKKASLRKDLESWRGRPFTSEELAGFDMANILGKACQLQVVDNGEGKSQIAAVVGVPKGTQVPPPTNPLLEYSVTEGRQSPNYEKLPEWVRKMADACIEWNPGNDARKSIPDGETGPVAPAGEKDDMPF